MTDKVIERCPHCQQKMLKPKPTQQPARICRNCRAPILVHHKWKCVTDGEASWFEHRHCDNPDSYHPKGSQ